MAQHSGGIGSYWLRVSQQSVAGLRNLANLRRQPCHCHMGKSVPILPASQALTLASVDPRVRTYVPDVGTATHCKYSDPTRGANKHRPNSLLEVECREMGRYVLGKETA